MRLTKQTGHAIRILIDCTHAGGDLVKVADISQRLDITKQNVFKIVHLLSHAGFVAPVRGPSGGVRLARSADSIRIGDVVRAIEVTRVEIAGAADTPGDQNPHGALNGMFDDALTAFISVLDQHTLADLGHFHANAAGKGGELKAVNATRSAARPVKKKTRLALRRS